VGLREASSLRNATLAETQTVPGMAYQVKAQYDRAITDFDAAIRLDPKLAAAFYNRGLAYGSKDTGDRPLVGGSRPRDEKDRDADYFSS
jgi:tetratricopeptide (TPR) repeat protein